MQRQKYYYDSLNQLIREDNLDLNKTFVYSYDLGGNLTSTKEYAYQTGATVTGSPTTTNTYTYGDSNWKDKLTAYNGNTITYDQIGNPLSYRNGFTFTWQKGRQLASASNGTNSVSYTYNNDGYRTSKTVNGTTTDYTLEGERVLIEKTGSDYVWFYYDAAGAPVAMATGSGPSLYIYRKNLQGDITGIYSGTTGTLLVSYVYDAWGKVTATDVAQTTESADVLNNNPYLYRGYRYDAETGLYYLNSRYYDPETGRFVNADDVSNIGADGEILSYNLFCYCLNNPANRIDNDGKWSGWATIGLILGAVLCTAAITILTCGIGTASLAGAVAVGAAKGALIGAAAGTTIGAGIGYASTGTIEGAATGAAIGFGAGAVIGAVIGGTSAYSSYTKATTFLKSQGVNNPDSVLSSYKGTSRVKTIQTNTKVYRTWGGGTKKLGHWVSPNNYGIKARALLSLPAQNTAESVSSFVLQKGTRVLAGKAAPLFGQPGGGVQWWVSILK